MPSSVSHSLQLTVWDGTHQKPDDARNHAGDCADFFLPSHCALYAGLLQMLGRISTAGPSAATIMNFDVGSGSDVVFTVVLSAFC